MKKSMYLILVLMVTIDQVSKICVKKFLKPMPSEDLGKNFINLLYLKNYGAAFGIYENGRIFFIFTTIIVAVLGLHFINHQTDKILNFGMLTIIAGGVGNLVDRVFLGYVIDFISLSFFPPVFNLADVFITIGVLIFIIRALFLKDIELNRRDGT